MCKIIGICHAITLLAVHEDSGVELLNPKFKVGATEAAAEHVAVGRESKFANGFHKLKQALCNEPTEQPATPAGKKTKAATLKHDLFTYMNMREGSDVSSPGTSEDEDPRDGAEDQAANRAAPPGRPGVDVWNIPHLGTLRYQRQANRRILGAHCPLGGSERVDGVWIPRPHGPGPCRLNRVISKRPVGFLGAWLNCRGDYASQQDHWNARIATAPGQRLDYAHRCEARRLVAEAPGCELLWRLEGAMGVEPEQVS